MFQAGIFVTGRVCIARNSRRATALRSATPRSPSGRAGRTTASHSGWIAELPVGDLVQQGGLGDRRFRGGRGSRSVVSAAMICCTNPAGSPAAAGGRRANTSMGAAVVVVGGTVVVVGGSVVVVVDVVVDDVERGGLDGKRGHLRLLRARSQGERARDKEVG